jgi:hypothetical protein
MMVQHLSKEKESKKWQSVTVSTRMKKFPVLYYVHEECKSLQFTIQSKQSNQYIYIYI